MKKAYKVSFFLLFSFCFVFSTFTHGFPLLPFLLPVFRFSSWFVPLFGYSIYMVEGRGLAFDAKVRGWLSDGRKYATELLFAYLTWNVKGNMKVFWVSHTLLEQRKVLWWFFSFEYLDWNEKGFMMVFCVSLSGCMVSIVICFSVIVLKDRRLCVFLVVWEAFFFRELGDVRFWGCSRGGFLVVFVVLR